MEKVRFIVLGGGTAGLTAATRVASDGGRVMVIDPAPIGGLCSLSGCNPKKIYERATEVLQSMHEGPEHGIHPGEIDIRWPETYNRRRRFTDPVSDRAQAQLQSLGVEYVKGSPHFIAPDCLTLGNRTVQFGGALIATGSTPRRLAFPGAQYVKTTDELFRERRPPQEMVIIGAGVVAFEFAQVFARIGTRVHVLARGERALRGEDAELVELLVEYSAGLGIDFHFSVECLAIEPNGHGLDIQLNNGQMLHTDYVLNAAGRVLSCEGLDLDKAEVAYSTHGIEVDRYLRSPRNPRVYVAGDAHGRFHLTPVAGYEARVAVDNFLHGNHHEPDYSAVAHAVFTIPPLASVGLTEQAAQQQGLDYERVYEDMSSWTVYAIAGRRPAFAKVLYERGSGRLLGAHLFAPEADASIHVFAMAIRYGITRERLREMLFVYPSLTSAAAYLA